MYFTTREKQIINSIQASPQGINVTSLIKKIGVSQRTLYRDLNSIKKTFQQTQQLALIKEDNSYKIEGNLDVLVGINDHTDVIDYKSLSIKDRRDSITLDLLLTQEAWKLDNFVFKYGISSATALKDLQTIESELPNDVKIIKEYGNRIETSEEKLRSIFIHKLSQLINDYQFFELAIGNRGIPNKHYFYVQLDSLQTLYQLWESELSEYFDLMSDVVLKQLILLMAVTIQRIQSEKPIETIDIKHDLTSHPINYEKFNAVFSLLEKTYEIKFDYSERSWLSKQFVYFIPSSDETIAYGNFLLQKSYQINKVIKFISTGLNMTHDNSNELVTHLASYIYQVKVRPQNSLFNMAGTFPEHVLDDSHRHLIMLTEEALKKYFSDITFENDDILYIVFHLLAHLNQQQRLSNVSVLIICSYGFGLAEVLKQRLNQYFQGFGQVECIGISELQKVSIEQFDIILSTNILENFEKPYSIVSPFLSEDDLKEVRKVIRRHMDERVETEVPEQETLVDSEYIRFVEIAKIMELSTQAIRDFELIPLQNKRTIEEFVKQISEQVVSQKVTAQVITEQLIQRIFSSPLGFPKTNLGFFHCLNNQVDSIVFKEFDLVYPIEIEAIDRSIIQLRRAILVIGNADIAEVIDVLSKISITVAETNEALAIFNDGNQQEIKTYLKQHFTSKIIQEVQNR